MNLSRRHFLEHTGITVGAALCGLPLKSTAIEPDWARAVELLNANPSIDLHCHPGRFTARGRDDYGGDDGVAQTVADMRAGNLWGGFFSIVADATIIAVRQNRMVATRSFELGEAWALYKKQLADLRELLGILPAVQADSSEELGVIHRQGEVAAFIACEGVHCLEGRPERVEDMYNDGVRSLQLAHFAPDGIGDLQTETPVHDGLSSVGRDVIREMNRLGMVVDLAHASYKTVLDAIEVSETPLLLSHSHLNWGEKRHPRLLEPEHAKAIAATGGVIGMWPSGFGNNSFEDFVDNTMRLIDLVDIEHVGLGTDMDFNYLPVFDSYTQLPDWTASLLSKGLTENEVAQVVGGNALRVIGQIM